MSMLSLLCAYLTSGRDVSDGCTSFMTIDQLESVNRTLSSIKIDIEAFKNDALRDDQLVILSNLTSDRSPCDLVFGDNNIVNVRCNAPGDIHFLIDSLYFHEDSILNTDPHVFSFDNMTYSLAYTFCKDHECYYDTFDLFEYSDTFTIIGDDHIFSPKMWDEQLYTSVVDNVMASNPSFHFSMGDLFLFSKQCKDENVSFKCCDEYVRDARPFLPKVPFYSVIGNWEETTLSSEHSNVTLEVLDRNLVKPDTKKCGNSLCTYYTFVKNSARFVVLDSETFSSRQNSNKWDQTLGEEQYRWLVNVLNTSTEKFHLFFVHRLLGRSGASFHYYEWGGIDRNNGKYLFPLHRPNFTLPIHDLIKSSSNPIVFVGHDHVYNREIKDNVVYLSVPQPVNPKPHRRELFPCTSFYHISPGHLEVTTKITFVKVEYVYFNLTVIDTFKVFLNSSITFDDTYDCMN